MIIPFCTRDSAPDWESVVNVALRRRFGYADRQVDKVLGAWKKDRAAAVDS
ncbi:hypothetical protein QIS74_01059 [Colletotrichum tabaci]|uniref:Uncharacterized protein n=1 Tax=Colletotrichum tabaci TaxID=1209068 RepID=A0AAV9TZL7_9PEZI